MKQRLRTAAAFALLVLLAVIVGSVYFFFQAPPLEALVDSISADVAESIDSKGEIPKWLLWAGGIFFSALLAITALFAWAIVDLTRVHYKIDSITFRLKRKVSMHISSSIADQLHCPANTDCATRKTASSGKTRSRFLNEAFYHFANQDSVGGYNQKDKRRHVFRIWNGYYMSNFIHFILLLMVLWATFIVAIRSGWPLILLPLALLALVVGSWWRSGARRYRHTVLELADEQIRAFIRHNPSEFRKQVAATTPICTVDRCPIR